MSTMLLTKVKRLQDQLQRREDRRPGERTSCRDIAKRLGQMVAAEEPRQNEMEQLIAGLRAAVQTLYGCRYSEQPLARKLDALLKEMTGKSQADLIYDWAMEQAEKRGAE